MKKIVIIIMYFRFSLFFVCCSDIKNEVSTSKIDSVFQSKTATETTSKIESSTEKDTKIIIKQSADNSQFTLSTTTHAVEKQKLKATEKSSVTEKNTSSQPTSKAETTTNANTTVQPKPTAEQIIEIDYYINFAKNYAQCIGLTIDNSATDCWDNPIAVTSKSVSVENAIMSRLNRYKNIENFSSVCFWFEKVSDNSFEFYIGYS